MYLPAESHLCLYWKQLARVTTKLFKHSLKHMDLTVMAMACQLGNMMVNTQTTVCVEIITELIPERVGPAISETLLLQLMALRPIPVICPARRADPENYWNSRQGLSRNEISNFQKLVPADIFPDPL